VRALRGPMTARGAGVFRPGEEEDEVLRGEWGDLRDPVK